MVTRIAARCALVAAFTGLLAPGLRATDAPPGVVIASSANPETDYIGSPGIAILADGSYVAGHDYFGRQGADGRSTRIFGSRDRGATWSQFAEFAPATWGSFLVHRGALYHLGITREYGDVVIRRSTDGGRTWTTPRDETSGIVLRGRFHTAPVPVVVHHGRLWRAVEEVVNDRLWPRHFATVVISAPEAADLLVGANWTRTNGIEFNETWAPGRRPGWLEGNVVVSPEGGVVNLLRVNMEIDGLVAIGDPRRDLKDAFPFRAGERRFLVLTDRAIPIYEALDDKLTRWQHRGTLDPQSAECPNFFEIDGHWVYLSSPHEPVRYRIGTFDPASCTFTPQTGGRINHDSGFYASTAYRDDRGRTILLGVSRGQKSSPAWTGVLALPRVLTIGEDRRPRMHPVEELQALRRAPFRLGGPVALDNARRVVDGLRGDTLEIVARFRAGTARAFGLRVRRSDDGKRALPVEWREGRIVAVRESAKFPCTYAIDPRTREVMLRMFLDKGMLDVGTGDGRVFESHVHQALREDLGVEIFAESGTVTLLSLEAWQMAPATITHSRLLE